MAAAAGTAAERGFETKRVVDQFECHGRVVDRDCVLSACGTLTDENFEHSICCYGPRAVMEREFLNPSGDHRKLRVRKI
jgi:hypothetical protein